MIAKHKKILNVSIVNLLSSTAEYISLAVMALYLSTYVSIIQTTVIISIPQMSVTFLGSISNIFERKLGAVRCLRLSSLLTGVAFLGLYLSKQMSLYVIFSIILGFAAVLYKPIMKSMFSSCGDELKKPDNVHRIRYITICVSSIIGPIVGMLIADNHSRALCLAITGASYLVISLYVGIVFSRIFEWKSEELSQEKSLLNHISNFRIRDKRLIIYILTGTLTYFVFIQFESIYSLFLTSYSSPEKIFSILLILNSICGLLFQFVFIVKDKQIPAKKAVVIGNIFFQVAFALFGVSFALSNYISLPLLGGAIIIYSLGEVLTIPALDIIIDNIAPKDKKSLYFGMAEIRSVGFTLGPIFAGYLLEVKNEAFASFSSVGILLLANLVFICGKKFCPNEQKGNEIDTISDSVFNYKNGII